MSTNKLPPRKHRYDYTEDEKARKRAYYEKIGRACHGERNKCWRQAATEIIRYYDLDDNGNRVDSEIQQVQACGRHKSLWKNAGDIEVVETIKLEPLKQHTPKRSIQQQRPPR